MHGAHHQSMLPSGAMSALERPSPMAA